MRHGRRLRTKTARAMLTMSHYMFDCRLQWASTRYPGRHIVGNTREPKASKTCGNCGHWKPDLTLGGGGVLLRAMRCQDPQRPCKRGSQQLFRRLGKGNGHRARLDERLKRTRTHGRQTQHENDSRRGCPRASCSRATRRSSQMEL
jgi:hypothetical protein